MPQKGEQWTSELLLSSRLSSFQQLDDEKTQIPVHKESQEEVQDPHDFWQPMISNMELGNPRYDESGIEFSSHEEDVNIVQGFEKDYVLVMNRHSQWSNSTMDRFAVESEWVFHLNNIFRVPSDAFSILAMIYFQTSYEAVYGILEDYMEIVLQFGFVTLFSIILPMVPLLAYISNAFEVRCTVSVSLLAALHLMISLYI